MKKKFLVYLLAAVILVPMCCPHSVSAAAYDVKLGIIVKVTNYEIL